MNVTPQTTTGLPDDWFLHPAVARIDAYLTGGSDHYSADRELASRLLRAAPWLRDMVAINQRHRPHAVTVLAREFGITQYLDLGCGLPSSWSRRLQRHEPALTYESAVGVHAAARVVYVDNDPMVCSHARAILAGPQAATTLQADICQIAELLDHPTIHTTLNRSQPIAVLAHDLLPWMDDRTADTVMASLRRWLPAGSAVSVTHASTDMDAAAMKSVVGHYAEAGIPYRPRPLEHIRSLLGSWRPLAPGLVPTARWRAGNIRCLPSAESSHAYAAIVTETPP
ncbi:SAM-dependent methyltransferase [Streptomyces chartreusis]|uniref:SAM-dependent methyltransferase n=1 Tax=Streptomyces chartreusis TaxID=1969 RepID=UPI003D8E4D11